jgi:hypothetical protein
MYATLLAQLLSWVRSTRQTARTSPASGGYRSIRGRSVLPWSFHNPWGGASQFAGGCRVLLPFPIPTPASSARNANVRRLVKCTISAIVAAYCSSDSGGINTSFLTLFMMRSTPSQKQLTFLLQSMHIDASSLTPSTYGGEFPIYHLTIPFADRVKCWIQVRAVVNQLACWPVIMDDLSPLHDYQLNGWAGSVDAILAQAVATDPLTTLLRTAGQQTTYPTAIDVLRLMDQELEALHHAMGDDLVAYGDIKHDIATALTNTTAWERSVSPSLEVRLGLAYKWMHPHWYPATTNLVFFPTETWWEIPAFIRYYPADPGPPPHEHVLFGRRWAEQYGAELVVMGRGSHSLRALVPPPTPAEALTLAWEQSMYCSNDALYYLDLLDRAKCLYQGEAWAFGWRD